jgi:hypothetical protein
MGTRGEVPYAARFSNENNRIEAQLDVYAPDLRQNRAE